MVKRTSCLLALGVALIGCFGDDDAPLGAEKETLGLDAHAILVRASLDVRGVRPTPKELDIATRSPAELDELIQDFVDDPRFGDRVRSIFAGALRTRQDSYPGFALDYGLEPSEKWLLNDAVAEEALNIIGYVAANDAPFTQILTANYTIVDPTLLAVWPLDKSPVQPSTLPDGTVMAHYNDNRPAAGVLATNSFFWRHSSTVDNANRGRSNAISRAFMCEDYLERPIDFPTDVNLADPDSIANAIKTNPGCQACHATLDPFASHLWGFMYTVEDAATWRTYQPENELMWVQATEAEPAFFGAATDGTLTALATSIANDERFVACTVRRVYESFVGRSAEVADEGQLALHREAFLSSGLSLKALVRSLLLDPAYRGIARRSAHGATPEPTVDKLTSPELLASMMVDLTGYRLVYALRDAMGTDIGLRALAGASERGAATSPSLGHVLAHRRLAEASAAALVVSDEATVDSRVGQLLKDVDWSAAPSDATLGALVREIRSREADESGVAALSELWSSVSENAGPEQAWSAVLTALLADPELAVY